MVREEQAPPLLGIAERAKEIIANFTPTFESKEAFLGYLDSLNRSGERITYGDGTAKIEL